jgi:hypothetical protein
MGKNALFWFVPLGISSDILITTRSGTEWRFNGLKEIIEYPLPRKGELETIFGDDEIDEDEVVDEDDEEIDQDIESSGGGEKLNLLKG